MSQSFTSYEGPLMMDCIKERTPNAAIAAMKNGYIDGAGGYDLHVSCLEEKYINKEELERIISSSKKPVLALHYNSGYLGEKLGKTGQERMDALALAAECGAAAVDMQGYTFDPASGESLKVKEYISEDMLFLSASPREVSIRPETVEKQTAYIERIHKIGAQVVLSTHTHAYMNCEQVVSLAKMLEKRGPDVIKIITPCANDAELAEAFRTCLELKRVMKTKFVFHCQGRHGKVSRYVCPMLGSYLAFCFNRYTESSNYEQLHLKTMSEFFAKADF